MKFPSRKERLVPAAILLFFAVLTLIHLYPLPFHPASGVEDVMDSLLNTWIVGWVQGNLAAPARLFDANAFHPHPGSLSYSEHLFPLALMSFPARLVSHNPVLVYNLLLFFAYYMNAAAMFFLVRRLTRNDWAGAVSGVIFAFNSFQLQHVTHLQIVSSWFIPLAFIHLHEFIRGRRTKDAALFSLFFTLQGLTCVYHGLFFISILAVLLPAAFLLHRSEFRLSAAVRFFSPLLPSALVLFLFSMPYFAMTRHFGFQRELTKGADLINYLAVVPRNILLGRWLSPLGGNEFRLSPGIFAVVLALIFGLSQRKNARAVPAVLGRILFAIPALSALAAGLILITGGFAFRLGRLKISARDPVPALEVFVVTALIAFAVSFAAFVARKRPAGEELKNLYLYSVLLVWSLCLSFGGYLSVFHRPLFKESSAAGLFTPFRWLHAWVPGFKGIRVPARYAVFVAFSLAVLAGYGFSRLAKALKTPGRRAALAAGLLLLINMEYLAVPQRMQRVPVGEDIPPTYRWLKSRPGNAAVLELPFLQPIGREAAYMYFSLFHGKPIVNGYSGFIPPATNYIRQVFKTFPSWECLDVLRTLDVRYLVLHGQGYAEPRRSNIRRALQSRFADSIKMTASFRYSPRKPHKLERLLGSDVVYEIAPGRIERPLARPGRELPPERWTVRSNRSRYQLPNLRDGRIETRWLTMTSKRTGDYLQAEFKAPENVVGIRLILEPKDARHHFAVSLGVQTSSDGVKWKNHEFAYSPGEFVKNLIEDPKNPVQKIRLDGEPVKFVRLTQYGRDPETVWSVAEMKLFVEEPH